MKKNGFTLIELLLVITIMMGLVVLEAMKMKAEADEASAATAGKEMALIAQALQDHLAGHISTYQEINNATAHPTMFPVVCAQVSADVCKLDPTILVRESLMAPGWQAFLAAPRSPLSIYIKRIAPPGGITTVDDYDLEAIARMDNPWDLGAGGIEWKLVGAAVRNGGPNVGKVSSGQVDGLFGAWSMPVAAYPGLADGQVVAVAKVKSASINRFVKLDGSLPMTGSLNMGDNRVNNIKDIELTGVSTLPRRAAGVTPMVSDLAPNWVLKSVYGVSDYDQGNGTVPLPTCPDGAGGTGTPRILVKPSALYNDMFGGITAGVPVDPVWDKYQQQGTITAAMGGWNFFALQDASNNVWRVYIRRYYDNGYIPGEGLAEVYCYYP